jgi:hypothetical protein
VKIVLAYKRRKELVNDTHLFDGHLMDGAIKYKLDGKTYAELIFAVSEVMKGHSHNEVFMVRLEQPSVEHALADVEAEMIRTHPTKYVEATSLPPQRIVVKVSDEVPVGTSVMTSIRAGINTLVDAFGDRVYLKFKDDKVESPFTGRWVPLGATEIDAQVDGAWVSVWTKALLSFKASRYFIPRTWNTSGPWITHEDLQEKYDKYIEEKENADR